MKKTASGVAARKIVRVVFRWGAPFIVLFAGAAGFLPSAHPLPNGASPSRASSAAAKDFPAAPAFKLKDLSGKEVQLNDFKGKVLVLNFWATWCGPCRFETPALVEFRQSYLKRGVEIVGVSLDDDGTEGVSKFVEQYKVPYPILMGDSSAIDAYGPIEAVPTTFIIDKDGRIRNRHVGLFSIDDLKAEIESLL